MTDQDTSTSELRETVARAISEAIDVEWDDTDKSAALMVANAALAVATPLIERALLDRLAAQAKAIIVDVDSPVFLSADTPDWLREQRDRIGHDGSEGLTG